MRPESLIWIPKRDDENLRPCQVAVSPNPLPSNTCFLALATSCKFPRTACTPRVWNRNLRYKNILRRSSRFSNTQVMVIWFRTRWQKAKCKEHRKPADVANAGSWFIFTGVDRNSHLHGCGFSILGVCAVLRRSAAIVLLSAVCFRWDSILLGVRSI